MGFIGFALFGGALGLWKKWAPAVHLPAAIWAALIEFRGWICPLTPLENRLRIAAGVEGYESGFVEHYVVPVIYPTGLTPAIQFVLGGAVIAVNVVVYLFVVRHRKRD